MIEHTECPLCGTVVDDIVTDVETGVSTITFFCGSTSKENSQVVNSQSSECYYKEGLKEEWRIINVFNSMSMDEGEAYPNAIMWLHQWEYLRPITKPTKNKL